MTRWIWFFLSLPLLSACTSGLEHPQTTFLTANDLTRMTDAMAQSLVRDPQVNAITARGPMSIVIIPAVNDTNEIIPEGRKRLFVHRLRVLLSQNQALRSRFTWVLNQAQYDALAAEGMDPTQLGPQESRIQPQYALKAVLSADTNVSSDKRSDYYLCAYQLTNLQTGEIVWEDKYETKKFIEAGFLD